MDQTCHANSGALGASGHNGICLDGPPDRLQASALANAPMLCHLNTLTA
jgi:hypothetical protein